MDQAAKAADYIPDFSPHDGSPEEKAEWQNLKGAVMNLVNPSKGPEAPKSYTRGDFESGAGSINSIGDRQVDIQAHSNGPVSFGSSISIWE